MAKKSLNFESAFGRLEQIVDTMGLEDTSLEESLKLYKEGVDLSVFLNDSLKNAKKEILILKNRSLSLFEDSLEEGEDFYDGE